MILAVESSCDDSDFSFLRRMSKAHPTTLTLCSAMHSARVQINRTYGVYG